MRMLRPLFIGWLALASCSRQGDAVSTRDGDPPQASVQVSLWDGAGAAGPFRIDGLEKLRVDVQATGLAPGVHQLRLDVLSPGGTLYAHLPAAMEAGATGEGAVSTELAVAGTTIERYRRCGTWTVRATLDGADAPLATAEAQVVE